MATLCGANRRTLVMPSPPDIKPEIVYPSSFDNPDSGKIKAGSRMNMLDQVGFAIIEEEAGKDRFRFVVSPKPVDKEVVSTLKSKNVSVLQLTVATEKRGK